MIERLDFHAHHSPLGAYATFTCGRFGAGGGMTILGARPPADELVVGYRDADGVIRALPFFKGADVSLADYQPEQERRPDPKKRVPLVNGLTRHYGGGTDAWTCGDLAFRVFTPVWDLPDPARDEALLQERILPVICCELTLDSRRATAPRTLFFGLKPEDGKTHLLQPDGALPAVGWDNRYAVAACPDPGVRAWVHWDERIYFEQGRGFRGGGMAGLALDVAPGAFGRMRIVLAFYHGDVCTTGIAARFFYTRARGSLLDTVAAGVAQWESRRARAEEMDRTLLTAPLDDNQRFLVAHAERSYWGNTWLLDHGGRPLWCVLEGEYAMHNTFDLTIDMCFYELRRNPWTVRNVLDQFVERYSYRDRLNRPPPGARATGQGTMVPTEVARILPPPIETGLPGGISFTHDMGARGWFSPPGTSSYELDRVYGCFSYMTSEQLLNWILVAASYVAATGDDAWLRERTGTVRECLESLENRDDPDPQRRTGIVSLDSDRCGGSWEITTYDSLDHSLQQARASLYMATKAWAGWLGLELMLTRLGRGAEAARARAGARRAAATIAAQADPATGILPAVFDGPCASAIIPAIEGLAYPRLWGWDAALDRAGEFGALIAALERHLRAILRPGVCLFPDGGWKMSSTSNNSWISKILLNQFVAARVFGIEAAPEAHAAHVAWQLKGKARDWAMCDQCVNGEGRGSKYYPRCVTADLWLGQPPIAGRTDRRKDTQS